MALCRQQRVGGNSYPRAGSLLEVVHHRFPAVDEKFRKTYENSMLFFDYQVYNVLISIFVKRLLPWTLPNEKVAAYRRRSARARSTPIT
jgi:hypothetical protein